ncbi:DUF6262 family protein [Sporosarcina sp. SG10008]|uniref:DUF6262 family protein n=1 Tax=Sporosarcina sp. SG10008 TaxID=3373103 RepID=UPI0037DD2A47
MTNNNPNVQKIIEFNKNKTTRKEEVVNKVITDLIKGKEKINFNTVAEKSGVSKSFLYKNKTLKERIDFLRNQQNGLSSPKKVKNNTSDKSKDVIIESLRQKVKKLEEENKDLKKQLQSKLSDLYLKI